ncbi:hypothetical protein F5X98DRAFT_163653 [Xylaria grammica]|nr:hypothetical protein F5X98DRAFT_163653 [Xylaria grammica]
MYASFYEANASRLFDLPFSLPFPVVICSPPIFIISYHPHENSRVGSFLNKVVLRELRSGGESNLKEKGVGNTEATTTGKQLFSQDRVLPVYKNELTSFLLNISKGLSEKGWDIYVKPITSAEQLSGEHGVIIEDAERLVLANITLNQPCHLVNITDHSSKIIWVTRGGLLVCNRAEFAIREGLAQVIPGERAFIHLAAVDFDIDATLQT